MILILLGLHITTKAQDTTSNPRLLDSIIIGIDTSFSLKPLPAYQEFWHSWQILNQVQKGNFI